MSLAAAAAGANGPPRFLGQRFDSAGRALSEPGNTVVAMLADGPFRERLRAIRARLEATEAGRTAIAWLPESSWHMTLFDGVLLNEERAEYWPRGLPRVPDRAEVTLNHMRAAIRQHPIPQPPYRMRTTCLGGFATGGFGIRFEEADTAERSRLRAWRHAIAAAAGLSHRPGHQAYVFHLTLGYMIAWPDQAAAEAFDQAVARELASPLPPPDFLPGRLCVFADMTRFDPVDA